MIEVSVCDRGLDLLNVENLADIFDKIKNGEYKDLVEEIRILVSAGKKEQADEVMEQLPWFLLSGIFDENPDNELIKVYSRLIPIEIMDVDFDNAQLLIQKIESISTTFGWFQSLEMNRITILVAVDSDSCDHEDAFSQVANFYARALDKKVEPGFQRITKPIYFSYSPRLYLNPNCEKFEIFQEDENHSELSYDLSKYIK